VDTEGAVLEASNGERLWLARRELLPRPPQAEPLPLSVGQSVDVRVLARKRGHLIVSQRAMSEPYLQRLVVGRDVVGTIVRRLRTGEYLLQLDPVRGVSRRPFAARTVYAASRDLPPNTRVVGRVSGLIEARWILLIGDLRRLREPS
jgi:hypothetical protein